MLEDGTEQFAYVFFLVGADGIWSLVSRVCGGETSSILKFSPCVEEYEYIMLEEGTELFPDLFLAGADGIWSSLRRVLFIMVWTKKVVVLMASLPQQILPPPPEEEVL